MKTEKVAILGYGMEGMALEIFLQKDAQKKGQNLEISILDEAMDPKAFADLSAYDVVYRSPGILLSKIKHGNISGASQLFMENCPCKIIGVTGTKGKGTTSTLIYEMLKEAGKHVFLGGNIGEPGLNFLHELRADSIVILEMSSFQLEDLTISPQIAVVLNVNSDHLDAHGDVESYRNAKKPIVAFQKPEDLAFINADYENCARYFTEGAGHKIPFHTVKPPIPLAEVGLRGPHNWENISPAVLVARHEGVSEAAINKVLRTFKGLPHRLEPVPANPENGKGMLYFNDSFSTNPDTSIAALRSFEEPVILIAGGDDKDADFSEWAKVCAETANLKKLILIGTGNANMRAALKNLQNQKLISEAKIHEAGTLKNALSHAREIGLKNDVVLLSPACASFDQFKNYKYRGEAFKAMVLSGDFS